MKSSENKSVSRGVRSAGMSAAMNADFFAEVVGDNKIVGLTPEEVIRTLVRKHGD